MTTSSKICNFIKEHPGTWRELLTEKEVAVKEDPPLAIFNYGLMADFTDGIVREARGIILRMDTLDVVCWPFTKFCNAHEEAARIDLEDFDWKNSHCQEKVDGSIIKLFWNPITGEWQWATNGCINAEEANVHSGLDASFLSVIRKCDNYGKIPFAKLDQDTTYIFELVSPQTQVVVKYPREHLYHIGTRNNITGEESSPDIGIEKPKEYPLHSLDDCIEAAVRLNADNEIKQEGFVVVDPRWHRIKVKSPEYLAMHRMAGNYSFSKDRIIHLIREGGADIRQLVEDFPAYAVYFKFYDYKMTELEWNVTKYIHYTRSLYEEYAHDRKAVAMDIKRHPLADFGFRAIGNSMTAKELLKDIPDIRYCKLIPDYEPDPIFGGENGQNHS